MVEKVQQDLETLTQSITASTKEKQQLREENGQLRTENHVFKEQWWGSAIAVAEYYAPKKAIVFNPTSEGEFQINLISLKLKKILAYPAEEDVRKIDYKTLFHSEESLQLFQAHYDLATRFEIYRENQMLLFARKDGKQIAMEVSFVKNPFDKKRFDIYGDKIISKLIGHIEENTKWVVFGNNIMKFEEDLENLDKSIRQVYIDLNNQGEINGLMDNVVSAVQKRDDYLIINPTASDYRVLTEGKGLSEEKIVR